MPAAPDDLPAHLRELLPLTSAVYFILFALVDGEKHGYAIMQDVSVLSADEVHMGPGTLYTTIQRLLELRLIEQSPTKSREDARRVYYRLTRAGKSLLEAETARLTALVRLARKKRLVPRNVL